MSEEENKTLQDKETVATEEETTVAQEGETSADAVNVEKEVESAHEEQTEETSEPSTDELAEGEEIKDTNVIQTSETSEVAEDSESSETHESSQSSGDISFTDYIDNIPQVKKGATIKGVIVRYDDENVYVDVRDKSEGRINKSEFDKDPDFDLDKAIAEKTPIDVYVKNIRYTDTGKDIQLSKARVDFAKHKEQVKEAFENKEPITVKVYRQVKDGLIASYGSVDVYIHRTQLENRTVSDERLAEYIGQDIEVLITQFDANNRRLRVSGSRRTLLNQERKERAEELWDNIAVGDIYEGVVRNITKFGAFVDLGGVDGLVHISELSWNHIKSPSEVVSVGDVIQVYVKDFDREKNRISLGYRRIEDDPYRNIESRFPVGTIVQGKVVRILNFGVFVEIAEGVDALCHISEISDIHLDKPGDVLEVGQEVTARVLEVSDERRRVSISIKAVEPINELRGEALERYEKREAEKAKREANRIPNSYHDSSQTSSVPSEMEKAFAAAEAQAEKEVSAETSENTEAAEEADKVQAEEVQADESTETSEN